MQTGLDHLTTGSLWVLCLYGSKLDLVEKQEAVSCIQIKCRSRILSIKTRATAACELTSDETPYE